MEQREATREMIEYVVRELVDAPGAVRVTVVPAEGHTVYEVHVAPADVGKVLGKAGRIAAALRVLAKAAARKRSRGARVYVEVVAPGAAGGAG